MKSRVELAQEGILLIGPVVPGWFKAFSDGCSVPKGLRWLMRAKYGCAACRIHDYRYHMIVCAYPSHATPQREAQRILADYELKHNRATTMRSRALGWLFGKLYYRGVRIGGTASFKTNDEAVKRHPDNTDDLTAFAYDVIENYPDLDGEHLEACLEGMLMDIEGFEPHEFIYVGDSDLA